MVLLHGDSESIAGMSEAFSDFEFVLYIPFQSQQSLDTLNIITFIHKEENTYRS